MKLSSQDKKDLDKYTKFLVLKSAQIIIQSRVGEKISTPCKPNTQGSDWVNFNLNINDLPDVLSATKEAFNGELMACIPLCVEISLRTPEGDSMVLETWCLSLLPEQCEPSLRIIHNVYNRMGILLKSLMSVTRVTPAYKLSRRQGPDSYIICYRIYMDEPKHQCLGDGFKEVRIGQICTPIGTLQLSVAYRTKMTISPTQAGRDSIMVKSDHFNSNSGTRRYRNSEDINDLTKPMKPGPFANPKPANIEVEPQLPGVMRLLSMGKCKLRKESEIDTPNNNSDEENIENLENENEIKENQNNKESSPIPVKMTISNSSRISNSSFAKSVDEEYWMKELSAPFAVGGPMSELMQFYKQCKKSPPLQSPLKGPTREEVSRMIEMFESQLPEYDALVQSFSDASQEIN